jgi:hypothetical protein
MHSHNVLEEGLTTPPLTLRSRSLLAHGREVDWEEVEIFFLEGGLMDIIADTAACEDEGGIGIRRGQVGDLQLLIPFNRLWRHLVEVYSSADSPT